MANFTFEKQGVNTYLVYTIGAGDELDNVTMGMLTNNKIAGIAPVLYTRMDTQQFLKYNISAKVSVKQFFAGTVNKKRLLGVFSGIASAVLSAEDYMLDTAMFLLDLDHIFVDVSSCETFLICLPVVGAADGQTVDMSLFFKQIVFSTQFDQTENADYVAKIINYLNGTQVFSLENFKSLLDQLVHGEARPQPAVPNTAPQPVVPPVLQPRPVPQVQAQPVLQPQTAPPVQVQPALQPQTAPQAPQPPVASPKPAQQQTAEGMAIPGGMVMPGGAAPAKKKAVAPVQASAVADEDEISFFYLMQHYNKENKAKYDAQQLRKKEQKGAGAPQQPKPGKPPKQPKPPKGGAGVPVPGGMPNVPVQGYAVPQPAQAQAVSPQPPLQPSAIAQTPLWPAGGANFGETTVLGGGGGIGVTTVLNAVQVAKVAMPHLVRKKNNERIDLNKPVVHVGKERSYVDYFIGDNPAISRSHADFLVRGSDVFVMDMNSKNHTFLNGEIVSGQVEIPLAHGDKLRLADEEFEFRTY